MPFCARRRRRRAALQEPVSYADRYSHPDELISLLKANLPKGKLEPMLIADNAAPRTVVQVNTLRISAEELAERLTAEHVCVRPHEWMADCLVPSRAAGSLEAAAGVPGRAVLRAGPGGEAQPSCAAGRAGARRARAGLLRRARRQELRRGHRHGRKLRTHVLAATCTPTRLALIENGAARLGTDHTLTARQQDASQPVPGVESDAIDTRDLPTCPAPASASSGRSRTSDIRTSTAPGRASRRCSRRILEAQACLCAARRHCCSIQHLHRAAPRRTEDVVEAFLADASAEFCRGAGCRCPDVLPKTGTGDADPAALATTTPTAFSSAVCRRKA